MYSIISIILIKNLPYESIKVFHKCIYLYCYILIFLRLKLCICLSLSLCMCMYTCACVGVFSNARRGCSISWGWSHGHLWATWCGNWAARSFGRPASSPLQSCLSSPISQVFHGVRKGKQQGFDKDSLSLLLPSCSFATTPPPASQLPEHRAQGMFLSSISKAHISTLVFLTSSLQKLCFLIWTITTSTQQPPGVFYSPVSKGRPNHG